MMLVLFFFLNLVKNDLFDKILFDIKKNTIFSFVSDLTFDDNIYLQLFLDLDYDDRFIIL
jgi:hypothetical protein